MIIVYPYSSLALSPVPAYKPHARSGRPRARSGRPRARSEAPCPLRGPCPLRYFCLNFIPILVGCIHSYDDVRGPAFIYVNGWAMNKQSLVFPFTAFVYL